MAQINQTSFDSLKRQIKEAEIAPLQSEIPTPDDKGGPDGPLEIAEALISGTLPPEKVDEKLLVWISETVDVPYVPDALEREALELVVQSLEGVVLQLLRRQIR